ncbi:MAG: aminodeoxychorismate lyase [Arenimonas sp.]|nr:aminodeoxychorismate lyase [Arenimonas sp.]MBP7981601.1 aminodeoxychorismate lyase [Arenimonas sp.]
MNTLIFRGNEPIERIAPNDRGLAYGDGLFETMLADQGELVWWDRHWRRLSAGALRLAIELPDERVIKSAAMELAQRRRVVIKIILTRGESGRGYAPVSAPGTAIISAHPAPEPGIMPIALRWCRTQIARQPALAGIKHLNRLENVLARSEWASSDYADGLMCDGQGDVICATSANLFIYRNSRWRTPDLSHCGIDGVVRQWLLESVPDALAERVSREHVLQADAVFVCNSVRGMMEVNRIETINLPESGAFKELRQRFLACNPAFATG